MVSAKVHKITHRHQQEVMLTAYTRRLDKIYANLGKSVMLPKVIKKMRDEHSDNPHEFYLQVCGKYGVTPEEEYDAYALVYGRTKFEKHKYEFTKNSDRESEKTETKQKVQEIKEEVHEVKKEDSPTPEPEEDEPEPEKPARRFSFERRSDRAENSPRYKERGYVSPRINSPRNHYRFKKKFVEDLDYVNVHPGDIVETMVLTASKNDQETGFWVPGRILSIDEDKEVMDVQVLQPIKYGLAERATNVPYRYVRSPANIIWKR